MAPSKEPGATYLVEYERHPELNGEYVEDGTMNEGKPKFKQRGGRGIIFYSGGRQCTLPAGDGFASVSDAFTVSPFPFCLASLARSVCSSSDVGGLEPSRGVGG